MGITTEDLKELVGDSTISEDTLLKIKMMIEAAIQERVDESNKTLVEQHEAAVAALKTEMETAATEHQTALSDLHEKANDYAQYVVEEMTTKVDAYAEYVVEKFVEDNKTALVEAEEYKRMQGVFGAIKEAFETAHFDLSPTDAAVELQSEVESLKESYNDVFGKLQAASKEIEEMRYAMVFESLTRDLAETQKDKLQSLIENVSFDSIQEFTRGVELMIEQVNASAASAAPSGEPESEKSVPEGSDSAGSTPARNLMESYLKYL